MTVPIRNILAYVIKSYDQWYRMPLIGQDIFYQFERCVFSGMFRIKAILVREKIPYSSKYDDNCLCIIFSNTFEIVGRREMGL